MNLRFESSVISFGSKTKSLISSVSGLFESSVISFGSKTMQAIRRLVTSFESSVISFGSKTAMDELRAMIGGLRVV